MVDKACGNNMNQGSHIHFGISCVFVILTTCIQTLQAQQNNSSGFLVKYNGETGSIQSITNADDPYKMNWIFNATDSNLKWQRASQDWGLGKYSVDGKLISWQSPSFKSFADNNTILTYNTDLLGVNVKRQPEGIFFVETYSFRNLTSKTINVERLSIHTPFNDNYPDAKLSATNRCNAHVWPGMHSSYVNAVRMDGEGPHLGLVFTKGAMSGYSIENRDRHKNVPWKYSASNVRGTIVLNVEPFTLKAGEVYTVQWKLFWHTGWEDFYKKAVALGFVRLEADRYVVRKNERLTINITGNTGTGLKTKIITVTGNRLGEQSDIVYYNGGKKQTLLNYLVISSPDSLVENRVRFIVKHQQMNNSGDKRFGAYMVYDNDADTLFTDIKRSVAPSDKDEGRERVGMGVLIAKWLQTHTDDSVRSSFMRYVKFVRKELQNSDYKLFSDVARTSPHRGYNYPWVAHLYLETYKLTKDKSYLFDFFKTCQKYFSEIGYKHYSIDFRVTDAVAALNEAGMTAEKDSLLTAYRRMADFFVETGIYYPSHEVNYEQSIVAPAVSFLCEMYLVTGEKKYLDAAKVQLRSLEAFNGHQPDVHLNDIAIRHWDGYWFGKKEMWGDVMPHYWSALTAVAFDSYYKCTGDLSYKKRAVKIVNNNLLNFKEDGRASCAYLYPNFINNKPGKFYDPFANDQDWALVFYMDVMEIKK